LRSIFITHHHPDHNVEYGPLLLISWLWGTRQVRAYGPPPLTQITEDFLKSSKTTADLVSEDIRIPPLRGIEVHELSAAGPVMQDNNVKVTSVLVQHPPVKPAFGYRFDFSDRSIAFSGDTVALEAVAQMAAGADVLVHEAVDFPAIESFMRRQLAAGMPGKLEDYMAHNRAAHASAEEAGRIAQQAGVKTLVLSHIGPPGVSDESWHDAAGKYFKGEIIVGHDLMVI